MTVEAPEREDIGGGPELAVTFQQVGPMCLLSLEGPLDAGTVGVLEAQFDRLGRTSCARVVVDLTELSHIDRTGARVLAGLGHYVRARGGQLTLLGAAPFVTDVLADQEKEPA